MLAAGFNIAGLLMNVSGVILLFRYGMPYRVRTGGRQARIIDNVDKSMIAAERRYNILGNLGLILIVTGTAAQIASIFFA